MISSSHWQEIKSHAFSGFLSDGSVDTQELEIILEYGCQDGDFDDNEKEMLVELISNLTLADTNRAMWAKIDELIKKFSLEHDSEATIESLDDDEH